MITKIISIRKRTDSALNRRFETMSQFKLFCNIKIYTIEAEPFFDGKNIPLNYFIERCEKTKFMLSNETESQFTKVMRSIIVEEPTMNNSGSRFQ